MRFTDFVGGPLDERNVDVGVHESSEINKYNIFSLLYLLFM